MENPNSKFFRWALALDKTYKFLIQHGDSNYEGAYKNVEGLISKKHFQKIYNEAQNLVSYFSKHQEGNTHLQSVYLSFFKRR